MTIRTEYSGSSDQLRIQRKIDQHYEMASLARQDRDQADADRHMTEVRRLRQLLMEAS